MSISQSVQCSFSIKLHPKQKCFDSFYAFSPALCILSTAPCGEKIGRDLNPFQIELQIF